MVILPDGSTMISQEEECPHKYDNLPCENCELCENCLMSSCPF